MSEKKEDATDKRLEEIKAEIAVLEAKDKAYFQHRDAQHQWKMENDPVYKQIITDCNTGKCHCSRDLKQTDEEKAEFDECMDVSGRIGTLEGEALYIEAIQRYGREGYVQRIREWAKSMAEGPSIEEQVRKAMEKE